MNKYLFIFISLLIAEHKNAYAMLEMDGSHRDCYIPFQKQLPTPIRSRPNPSKDTLKIDKDRQIPYYGNILSPFSYGYANEGKTLRATAKITESDLFEELKKQDPNQLRVINLIDQGLITDNTLLYLSENFPNITFLNVQNTRVTESGIERFKSNNPNAVVRGDFY